MGRHAIRWHVADADKATIYGIPCKLIHDDTDGKIFQAIGDENTNFTFTHDRYEDLLDSQEFDLEPEGSSLKTAQAKLKAGVSSVSDLAKAQQALVHLREVAILKFRQMCADDEASRTEYLLDTVMDQIQAHVDAEARKHGVVGITLPKAHEFLKWVRWYDAMGTLGIVPRTQKRGNRKDRYCREVLLLVRKHAKIFLRGERPTRELAHGDLKVEISNINKVRRKAGQPDLPTPDYDFMCKAVSRLAPFDVAAGRHLEEHAKRKFHPSRGGVPNIIRAMQRIEMDDWECHLHNLAIEAELWESLSPEVQEAAEKTRCTLTVAIDCFTRVLPAVVLSLGPHSVNTKTLLRMCMTDKTPLAQAVGCETPWEYRGNPWNAAGDEGSPYLNSITKALCSTAGIEYISPQIETPQQRPKVERVFQTLEIRSLLRFSGRAFNNPQVRGKYEAEARAVTTVEELAHLLVRFIVDVYHNTPHDGLDGDTPRNFWLSETKKMGPRASGKPFLRRVFGERYKVTLHPNGIEIFGNWYTNPVLEKRARDLPERDYVVIVDEEDLGGITVEIEDGEPIEVVGPACMNGVNVDVWNMALASMRRGNKHVQDITEETVLRAIENAQEADTKTRARLAIRWRLKTPEELEKLRNSIGPAIQHAAKRAVPGQPEKQVDMFAGSRRVGTKAPQLITTRDLPQAVAANDGAISRRGLAKPKPPKSVKPAKAQAATPLRPRKPPREWKPKERK